MKEKKISSNNVINLGLLFFAIGLIFLLIAFIIEVNFYLSIVIEIMLIPVAYNVFQRIRQDVYYNKDYILFKTYKGIYEIPLMRLRRIRLTNDYVNSNKKYVIEYIDDNNEFVSLSFYVGQLNIGFDEFLSDINKMYPFVTIE